MDKYLFFTNTFSFPHNGGTIEPIEVVGGFILQFDLKAICEQKGHTNYIIKNLSDIDFIQHEL